MNTTSSEIRHISIAWQIVKHSIDWVLAAIAIIFLSPIIISIALAIKIDDGGPIFFRQTRLGRFAREFQIWKFRTMIVNADRYLDERGRPTKERITSVGRVLRRYSLDEIPQLFDILRGEMSLVGPRPMIPAHLPRLTDEQCERFAVRPGVTGLAQVAGRNTIPWSRRIELDREYIRIFSPRTDLQILWRTFGVVWKSTGIVLDRNPELADDLLVAKKADSEQRTETPPS